MAESSNADAMVSGLKVILDSPLVMRTNVRSEKQTPELMLYSAINFRSQTSCYHILLSQILCALVLVLLKVLLT
jgi:hypothetical protein